MSILSLMVRTPLSEALGWTLLHSLWEGSIIAAALALLLISVRSPRIRYVAGCVALTAMLASFLITLNHFLPERVGAPGMLTKLTLPSLSPEPDMNRDYSRFSDFGASIPWLSPMWIVGVCVFYIRYAAGRLSISRMRRRGVCKALDSWQRSLTSLAAEVKISRFVALLESLLVDTPVILGHFRPVVLVPLGFLTGLSLDHVEAVLLHELAHVKRSDYFVNSCQRLVEGLLFYHPAMWWISSVIRTERENCCDDMVVNLRGDARTYALALTALEQNRLEQQWPARETAIAATGGNLMERIKRLLYPKGPAGLWPPALAAVFLMVSTALVMAAWQANPYINRASTQTEQQLDSRWQNWLNEDVIYIISDQERAAFALLKTDEERQQFVEQFWERRNPTPGAPQNEFKEEHYRRIAYANTHYRGALPGWKTDRGRIYIRYGPPDEIDSHPHGGSYNRPESEGGGVAMTYPFEDWRYAHFENVGSLSIEFVDRTTSGDFRMTLDPTEKYKQPATTGLSR